MGTWGVGSFGNDNAADWIWELEEADDLSVVEAAIARVLDGVDELVESPEAEEAIAAAEDRNEEGLTTKKTTRRRWFFDSLAR